MLPVSNSSPFAACRMLLVCPHNGIMYHARGMRHAGGSSAPFKRPSAAACADALLRMHACHAVPCMCAMRVMITCAQGAQAQQRKVKVSVVCLVHMRACVHLRLAA
jgi:hypothetical protein